MLGYMSRGEHFSKYLNTSSGPTPYGRRSPSPTYSRVSSPSPASSVLQLLLQEEEPPRKTFSRTFYPFYHWTLPVFHPPVFSRVYLPRYRRLAVLVRSPVLMAPSPEVPRRANMEGAWPPKTSSVKDMPRTGFSPTILRDHGYKGKRFVWPPPPPPNTLQEEGLPWANRAGGIPREGSVESEESEPHPPPFAPQSPQPRARQSTDHLWPPRHCQLDDVSPTPSSPGRWNRGRWVGRYDNFVKWQTSVIIPPSYHVPPGTQHVVFEEEE